MSFRRISFKPQKPSYFNNLEKEIDELKKLDKIIDGFELNLYKINDFVLTLPFIFFHSLEKRILINQMVILDSMREERELMDDILYMMQQKSSSLELLNKRIMELDLRIVVETGKYALYGKYKKALQKKM